MIEYKKQTLNNGLQVILHKDTTSPMVTVNTLYKVGSKHESPNKTGMAHLFEHLMFGGSENVKNFDKVIDLAGGSNNAFTTTDYTNYYITLPGYNIETALWADSDRMLNPLFTQEIIDTQKKVVIEEFKERYLNRPYGDVLLHLMPLCYKKHPYQWPTIGKKIEHIENVTKKDILVFFKKHYSPRNAILSIAGNIDYEKTFELVEKWYGDISSEENKPYEIVQEPQQTESRKITVESDVSNDAIYMAFPMGSRSSKQFITADLLSDVLSPGKSSRLHQNLINGKQIFNEINAYITGNIDNGLFIISGKLSDNVKFNEAEQAIIYELDELKLNITEHETQKVINKTISMNVISKIKAANIAVEIGYATLLGDTELINSEILEYKAITKELLRKVAADIFSYDRLNVLYYKSQK